MFEDILKVDPRNVVTRLYYLFRKLRTRNRYTETIEVSSMSAQAQLDEIFSTLKIKSVDEEKINDLRECFDEDHVDVFLEKLDAMTDNDNFLNNEIPEEESNQLIDFISDLILKK